MSDYSSIKTSRTYVSPTSAVSLWWNIAKRRSNSDSASIISRCSNRGKKTNRLSVPDIHPPRDSRRPNLPSDALSSSYDDLGVISRSSSVEQDPRAGSIAESAVSDISLDDTIKNQPQNSATMGDRGVRQNDRIPIVDSDDRRERIRTGRNSDTNTTSTRAATPAPSLFEACRELRRHGVKVSLPSTLSLSTANSNNVSLNNQSRQSVAVNHDRVTIPSYPEHLLNLPTEASLQDICLRTALNAGAAVDFIPRTSSLSLSASEALNCEFCKERLPNEQEWDNHASREKTYCPFCESRFDCHGLLLRHSCTGRRV